MSLKEILANSGRYENFKSLATPVAFSKGEIMFNKTRYDSDFIRERYHRYNLNVPKAEWEEWEKAAEAAGMPMAAWIKMNCNNALKKPTD